MLAAVGQSVACANASRATALCSPGVLVNGRQVATVCTHKMLAWFALVHKWHKRLAYTTAVTCASTRVTSATAGATPVVATQS